MKPLVVAGVRITPLTVDALHTYIASCIRSNRRVPVLNANVHAITLAQHDDAFRAILNAAPVTFCDGFGVRLGARLLGHVIPPRITYADWIYALAPFCVQHGFSLYLLGARPGIAEQAAQQLLTLFPQLSVVGTHHGYSASSSVEQDALVADINTAKPDILLVAMSMPRQEKWIAANLHRLDVHVALSGGAVLDYVAGSVRRGPPLLVNHGFEWLARLLIEPRRLWRRYVLGNPYFLWLVARQWWNEHWR